MSIDVTAPKLLPPTPLPPTPRDFDIHRACLVHHTSTRQIAARHGISQTRVRQVITRVSAWLAAALPVKTEAEQEQETRLAQHLAADQLRHQIEELQIYWNGTSDPKYLRQQSRVVLALARLGIVPGAIESLAADVTEGPYDPSAPQQPWSEADPWANSRDPVESPMSNVKSHEEATNPHTDPQPSPSASGPSTFDIRPSTSSPPPSEACSPSSNCPPSAAPDASPTPRATPYKNGSTGVCFPVTQDDIDGLNLFEERLLTLISQTASSDTERLASLNKTLQEIRQGRAELILKLSPDQPGATLQFQTSSPATKALHTSPAVVSS